MDTSKIPEFKLPYKSEGNIQFKLELISANSGYNPIKPHRHDYYEIFLFEEGGGLHMIDFNELEIVKNQIHVLTPGQVHFMKRDEKSHGLVIKFTPEYLNIHDKEIINTIPFLKSEISSPIICPNPAEFDSILALAQNIKVEFDNKQSSFQSMIRTYLNLILLKCDRLYDFEQPKQNSESSLILNNFKNILEQNYTKENRVTWYCDQLNVSTDKLNQVLKERVGKTPSALITERLLLEAKRLLLHSPKSIKEVAYHLNFQDNAYFNRWFNKLENCSPGVFRTNNREKYNQ